MNIVERLRAGRPSELQLEAADEIERMRAALDRSVKSELRMEREAADAIERLRVALHKSEAGLLLAQFELQALTGREQGLCRTREEADLLHQALLTGRKD